MGNSLAWYHKNKHRPEVKAKIKARAAKHYQKNKETVTEKALAYYYDNHEDQKARKRDYMKNNPEDRARNKAKAHAKSLGITCEELSALREKTLCDICGQPFATSLHQHIDHCHETNKVRGTLCQACNLMLGHAKDNVETLRKAIAYLTENKEPQDA